MVVRVGYSDEELRELGEFVPERDDEDLSESKTKSATDRREKLKQMKRPYLSEKRQAEFLKDYDCVVVHDFGDEYHLSEEERAEKNRFYEAFKKFSKFKHKYRKLHEYIDAMREALKCLDVVAENNGIYEPDKFRKMFLSDKIFINGLILPKYSGKDRKSISMDYLTEFILSDKPSEEIYPKKYDEILTDEEMEDEIKTLFTEEELVEILTPNTEEVETELNTFFDRDSDEQGELPMAVEYNRKEMKKFLKSQPEFLGIVKQIKSGNISRNAVSSFICDITADDIESIAMYDKENNFITLSEVPEFKGDISKDSDYNKYLRKLEEYEETQIKQNYHGKMKTLEQINEIETKELLESNGWNIRNIYGNKEREEKLKRIQRKERIREKELRDKLLKVENRRKRRLGEDVEEEVKKKSKKKKKNKEKNKETKKTIKEWKQQTKQDADEFLKDSFDNASHGSFSDWEKSTLDFSWENIMN